MAGGFLVLVLAALLARFAAHDAWVKDQLFLYLLRGVVDVGLPYALYVYADRRVAELPLGAGPLFLAFAAGALCSIPLTVLDRLAAAGSWARLQVDLTARADAVLAGQLTTAQPALATAYLVERGVLVVAWYLLVAAIVSRLAKDARSRPAQVLFAVVAAGAGLASFTRSTLELPFLTERWQLLLARDGSLAQIDWDLLASYFAFALPALVLALVITRERPPRRPVLAWSLGAVAGYALHLGVTLAWQHHEAYLRSSGILPLAGLALFATLGGAVAVARRRVEAAGPSETAEDSSQTSSEATSMVPRLLLVTGGFAALVAFGWVQVVRAHPLEYALEGTAATLSLAPPWSPIAQPAQPAPNLAFRQPPSSSGTAPLLLVATSKVEVGTAQHLTHLVEQGGANLQRFRASRIESWERYASDAWAVDYAFEQKQKDGTMLPIAATTAVVPLDPTAGEVAVLTLLGTFADRDRLRWDLALAAQKLVRPPR
jgi:hypothetical protein